MNDPTFKRSPAASASIRLPDEFRALFWDHAFEKIDFDAHRDFVIGRVLIDGEWSAVLWLRREVGDDSLRD